MAISSALEKNCNKNDLRWRRAMSHPLVATMDQA